MKKQLVISILLLITIHCFPQAPNWAWAASGIDNRSCYTEEIATDSNGNVYITGTYWGISITFGTTTLLNKDTTTIDSLRTSDIFIVKYNCLGNLLYAKSEGGVGADFGRGMAVNANGELFVSGVFCSHTITFGSTTLINSDTTMANANMFLVKYDASGNVLSAISEAGKNTGGGKMVVDRNQNLILTGYFQTSISFGTTTLFNPDSTNHAASFIVKYDASGNVIWAKAAVNSGAIINWGISTSNITTDTIGSIYMDGYFGSSTATFGTITLNNADTIGNNGAFIVKYNSSGDALWAKSLDASFITLGWAMGVDESGSTYIAGSYYGDSITIGTTTLYNHSYQSDILMIKYSTSGNLVWAKGIGGTGNDGAGGVTVDGNGDLIVTGNFSSSSLTFGTSTITNTGGTNGGDIFVSQFDASGNALWATSAGGTSEENGQYITTDVVGNVYISGFYRSPSVVIGSSTLLNTDSLKYNIFVAKLGELNIGINEIHNQNSTVNISPNPFTSQTTITFGEAQQNTTIKINNVLGEEIKTIHFTGNQLTIEKGEMKPGIYFVRIMDEKKNVVNRKIMVQ